MIHHISGRMYELREPLRMLYEVQAVTFEGLGIEPPPTKENPKENVRLSVLPAMMDNIDVLNEMIVQLIVRQRVLNDALFTSPGNALTPEPMEATGMVGGRDVKHGY